MAMSEFDKDFIFGAATAAYQIEGEWNRDGKGPSIWDTFSHTKGKIADGTNGDTACDHYNLFNEDIAQMAEMGLQSYRFSLSWPRIFPEGRGGINQKGLDFYSRLIDTILEKGMIPFVTLYHWDLPEELMSFGGWQSRDTASYFADYVSTVVSAYRDRVNKWITLNEPNVFWSLGHLSGEHAPGLKGIENAESSLHPILLAHGMGVRAVKALQPDAETGLAMAISSSYPYSDSENDRHAAQLYDDYWVKSFLDPVFTGKYPESIGKVMPGFLDSMKEGDMEIISSPIEFLGINHYSRSIIKSKPESLWGFEGVKPDYPGVEFTEMDWEIFPEGMYNTLQWIKNNYVNVPVFITENGCALSDDISDGRINDEKRISYYREYISNMRKAMDDGVNVKGYFAWSLMDNFEWAYGESKRFGLWHIDYKTKKRTWKDSAYWYQKLCRERAVD